MALLQKKPQLSIDIPLFQSANEGSILLVGLGNPGKKYAGTRHNIGFECIDAFAAAHDFQGWKEKSSLKALVSTQTLSLYQVVLAKPSTYMNLSGEAVQSIKQFYKLDNSSIYVVYDDIDITFGTIRTRQGGSAGGHNGVASVINTIGDNFQRIKVGVGPKDPPQIEASDFVLGSFTKKEQTSIPLITKEVVALATESIFSQAALPQETRNVLI